MGLLVRLGVIDPETWPNVEAAAIQRYWDALAFATASDNHRTGAIYLMGYAVEMLMKTATCRLINVPWDIDIKPLTQVAAGASTKTLHYGVHDTLIAWPGGNFHSLETV